MNILGLTNVLCNLGVQRDESWIINGLTYRIRFSLLDNEPILCEASGVMPKNQA